MSPRLFRFLSLTALVTLVAFAAPTLGDDTKSPSASAPARNIQKKPEIPTSPDVTTPPPAGEFILIPLRVHVLQSETLPEIHCSLSDEDIQRIVRKANKVWSVAGIHFGIESIRREKAAAQERFKEQREANPNLPLNLYRQLAPADSRSFAGQHVYYIHKFSVNGVFLGNKVSFVQETAKLRPVPGGIDEPLPRVTAHELGHALSLPHRQDRTNLLASGTTGTLLNEAEVKQVRGAAAKMAGALTFADLEAAAAKGDASPEETQRIKRWMESIREIARSSK